MTDEVSEGQAWAEAAERTEAPDVSHETIEQPAVEKPPRQAPQKRAPHSPMPEAAESAQEETPESAPEVQETEVPQLGFQKLEELAAEIGVPVDSLLNLQLETEVDGKKANLTLAEIRKGYQLDQHNSNKSKELSAQLEKATAAERAYHEQLAAQQQHTQMLNNLGAYAQQMLNVDIQQFNTNPEIQNLKITDPARFVMAQNELRDRQAAINAFLTQVGQQEANQRSQAENRQKAQVADSVRLIRSQNPEWADDSKFNAYCNEVASVCAANGFSREDLSALLTKPAYFNAAVAAMNWWNLQKSKPAAVARVKAAPKLAVVGTRQSVAQGQKLQQLKARLRANPKDQDVAAAAFGQYAEDSGLLNG